MFFRFRCRFFVGTCERDMSTKRKALGHPRSADRVHTMKSRTSRPDSERDSGFSGTDYSLVMIGSSVASFRLTLSSSCLTDASSEQMSSMETTDSEDSTHPVVRRGHRGSGLAVVGGSYSSLSPMIIMNNVLLKQVTTLAP